MFSKIIVLLLIPSIPVIAILDNVFFKSKMQCSKCGNMEKSSWHSFLLPTTLEVLLFLAGIAYGVIIMQ